MPPERQMVPLSDDARGQWDASIKRSQAARDVVQRWADANLKKYAPMASVDPEQYEGDLNTNRDFTLVERKKADLFYQQPDVTAKPSPLFEGQEALLDTHVAILNEKLGPDGVDAKALAHEVLFDVLCTSGTGWSVMGYESTTVMTETMDPNTGAPISVPVPVFEDCFWRHLSSKQILVPDTARSSRVDDWSWIGYEFEMAVRVAKRKGWVPEDFTGAPSDNTLFFDHGLTQGGADAVVRGSMIFYKSALYRDDIVHPQHLTMLVLINGVEQPAEHKDCPYQTLDPKGALTPDSLIGFPVLGWTTRTNPDAAYVPSDCTISRPLVNELNKFREQMVEQRDNQLVLGVYNAESADPAAIEKMMKARIFGLVGVTAEMFAGDGPIKPIERGNFPRENFTVNDYLDNDLARTHALDSNQSGAASAGDTTATEAQIQQSNVNSRLGLERGVVLDHYLKGVTKYSTLVQRYLSVEDAAKIVGQENAGLWDQWRHNVPSSLAFTAMPDAALRADTAIDRKQAMDLYSFMANEPTVNRAELAKNVLRKHHINPAKLVVQAPPKGPEPAKPSFAFTGEDLNPLAPQFAITMEILRASGFNISPEAIQSAQEGALNAMLAQRTAATQDAGNGAPGAAEHGGKQPMAENLSKHAAALTGGMQGTGQPAPMGAGGMQ